MKLTANEIHSAKVPWNYCLIKLPQSYLTMLHNHYEYKAGNTSIMIDTSFDPATYAPRWGMVVKNPENLLYKRGVAESMGWKTKVETIPGDLVYFDYFSCLQALGKLANPSLAGENPHWYQSDNDLYVLIRYDSLIMAVREDRVVCLNGNVVLRPSVKHIKTRLLLPKFLQKKEEELVGEVVYSGTPNEEYLDGVRDAKGIATGDTCVIKKLKLRLENTIDSTQEKGLYFVQLKNIWLILNRD